MILRSTKKFKIIIIYNNKITSFFPSKNSSKTTFLEDLNFPLKISDKILITCFFVLQIVTPFPAAKPSALQQLVSDNY